jgi:hypothetical protein
MAWEIFMTSQVKTFLESVEKVDTDWHDRIDEAILQLHHHGPAPGRPLVDRIAGSRPATSPVSGLAGTRGRYRMLSGSTRGT